VPATQANFVRLSALAVCGGTWMDASTIFVQREGLRTMWNEMMAANRSVRLVSFKYHADVVFSWFIMALPGAPIIRQWHSLLSLFYATHSHAEFPVLSHPLFRHVSDSGAVHALQRLGSPEYLLMYVAFLAIEEYTEWRGGQWRRQVLARQDQGMLSLDDLRTSACPQQPSPLSKRSKYYCMRATLFAAPAQPGHTTLRQVLRPNARPSPASSSREQLVPPTS